MNQKTKQILFKGLNAIVAINVVLYLLSCLTPFVNPAHFFPFTFLALAFPLLLLSMIFWMLVSFFYKKKQALILFVFLLLGYKNIHSTLGLNFSQSTLQSKQGNSFRVLSWNVKAFLLQEKKADTANNPMREMLKFIKSTNADIFCLQDFEQTEGESYFPYINYIKNSLHYPNIYFSIDIDTLMPNGRCRYGTLIFSKFNITNSGSISYTGNHFKESLGYADLEIDRKTVRIFNTHLRSMYIGMHNKKTYDFKYVIDDTNLVLHSTTFEKLKRFDTAHVQQAMLIKSVMDTTKIPYIFCADLNSVSSSYVYHHISKNLTDAFVEKGFGWSGTYSGIAPFLRIDVVLMSKELQPTNYFSPRLELSDHYPIVTDISFKK